ncbi:hypothetical protein [Halobaculum limi]|uniref:hypothetical protein n=1 Tax=Halobaculum limi TaxID=3031916 RepID=UPI002405EA26|nr:hypothetical protein [Halobaculum sp. YSMS11]
MSSRGPDGATGGVPYRTLSRRRLLAAGGVVAAGSFAGCLNRVASAVTNTGASPAAVFAGTQEASMGEFVVGVPHVRRLTPSLSGRVEIEGWVTSSPVMAQNHNSSRSNAPGEGYARDTDDDDDGLGDGTEEEELEPIYDYLGGEAMIAERFTVCLPDAEVPGGNGSIREAVTPERLIGYLTGNGEGTDHAWGRINSAADGGGDCDDDDPTGRPGAACGTTPHFVAEVTGPVSTGGGLEVIRAEDGSVLVVSLPPGTDNGSARVCATAGDDPCGPGVWARTTESGSSTGVSVYQMMVQPPRCPEPFPGLLYVQRCESNDQLVYSGGWVIDDAALYENSVTVVSMVGPTEVVGIELSDLGDSFEDVAGEGDVPQRMVTRRRRGARLDLSDAGTLVERGVLSKEGNDLLIRKKPGGRSADGGGGGGRIAVLHLAVDAPVLHLVSAGRASNEVKFKAGAELSGKVT